jgi:1,4-dihydroxy-2-naphthoyl-CoA hydrolase
MNTPLEFTVPFDETDREGIVFFGNYFRLAHRALEAYLPTIGIAWAEWFDHPEWGVPLRHAEADYLKPLRAGDRFVARLEVAELGESSVSFEYEFLSPEGMSLARLKTAHVFLSRATKKKMAIPAEIRDRLKSSVNF